MTTELGRKYKDKITGFVGTATGWVTYISGCNQVLLQPEVGEDNSLREAHWFDEQRLLVLAHAQIILENGDNPGFDVPAPKR